MQPFALNRHGKIVLPSNIFPEIDCSQLETLDQLSAVIKRDFEDKAPTATDIVNRLEAEHYPNRYELLRDLSLHLFWVNRFSITLYEKRPTAWRNVPKRRSDVFLPIVTPWLDAEAKTQAIRAGFWNLATAWDAVAENTIFERLFDILGSKKHQAAELPAIKPTVAEILQNPQNLTFHISLYDPDFFMFSYEEILDCHVDVPELETLMRWAMVLHNQYPWHRHHTHLIEVGKLRDDDIVPLFYPRNREVLQFINRVKERPVKTSRCRTLPRPQTPMRPFSAMDVLASPRFPIKPQLASLAVSKGERLFSNDDLIRNAACHWSSMSAADIVAKTGIHTRRYTERSLEELSLDAAARAVRMAGLEPADIGAVIFCTCTSTRLIPSTAAWISGELGIQQTYCSVDLISACAGFAFGMADAVRILQEVNRPVLLVCGEKFSDKIGSVRTSRMIFGDGAAAMVIAPAAVGQRSDIEAIQTYASGPHSEVNAIIWPNPEFGNNITVFGPDVQALVQRYLNQMMIELSELRNPVDVRRSMLESIDLVVPHQANRTMVVKLAKAAGLAEDKLYFNIGKVGNTSSASVPIALFDAVEDGTIKGPCRILTPCFGAGAVAGYVVLRFDPKVLMGLNQ